MSTNLLSLLNGEFQSSLFPKNLCALCGNLTMEEPRVRSKEFLIKKYSELCELCIAIRTFSRPAQILPTADAEATIKFTAEARRTRSEKF